MTVPISIFCPFCQKHTALTLASKRVQCGKCLSYLDVSLIWEKMQSENWWIGICNACHEAVLVLNNGDLIFPHPLPSPTDTRIPGDIRNDLEEAKNCLAINAYRACCVMARRAMQSACLDKGATKDKLVDQIAELLANGVITNDLKGWADVVRWVGNDAAHPGKSKVAKEDADDILHLAEQFLHVIYVAPAIAIERQTKRGKP